MKRREEFGAPGAVGGDRSIHRHRAYCKYFGQYFTWDEYQSRVNARTRNNRYGKPGARIPNEAKDHARYCRRKGRYFTWDEYRASVRSKKMNGDDMTPEAIAERVERNREMLRQRGLLAA